jgi:hypothetical protein
MTMALTGDAVENVKPILLHTLNTRRLGLTPNKRALAFG